MDTSAFRSVTGSAPLIPYLSQPQFHLGPITIHAFGVLVATGILLAFRIIRMRAAATGLDPVLAERLAMRMVIIGFISAHVFDQIAYYPREVLANPLRLLYIWQSISSFGGILGGTLVAVWFVKRQVRGAQGWRYLDLLAYAFPFAWVFGRAGCAFAFDHPGYETKFFLAEVYTDHVVRHNLGLDEMLLTVPLVLLFWRLGRGKPRAPGFFVGLIAVVYAPIRFLLDTLRWDDARYFGFTPGQYSSIALLVLGVVVLYWASKRATTE
jgi:phosphatidylglycerol:prolipoprotein diacylglycerol transferase